MIKLLCKNRQVVRTDNQWVVELSRNVDPISVTFDEEWNDLNISITFRNGEIGPYTVDFVEGMKIPPQFLETGEINVSFTGRKLIDGDDVEILRTSEMRYPIKCHKAGDAISVPPPDLPPDIWEQAIAKVDEALKNSQTAIDQSEAAVRGSQEAIVKTDEAVTIAGNALVIAQEVRAEFEKIKDKTIPDGGTEGQVLGKLSGKNNDVGWIDQAVGVSNWGDLQNKPFDELNTNEMEISGAEPNRQLGVKEIAQSKIIGLEDKLNGIEAALEAKQNKTLIVTTEDDIVANYTSNYVYDWVLNGGDVVLESVPTSLRLEYGGNNGPDMILFQTPFVTADQVERKARVLSGDMLSNLDRVYKLKPLTFTGVVSGEYDGTKNVEINIPSGGGNQAAVLYTPSQGLSETEKEDARKNIGADATLTKPGQCADAKAVGDYFRSDEPKLPTEELKGKFVMDNGNQSGAPGFDSSKFTVKPHQTFQITCEGGANVPFASFYRAEPTSSKTLVSNTGKLDKPTLAKKMKVTVPETATVMVVNNRSFENPAGIKCTEEKIAHVNLLEEINKNDTKISEMEYDSIQLERRALKLESRNPFVFAKMDKSYFVFIHHDLNAFIADALPVFEAEKVPLSSAAIFDFTSAMYEGKTGMEWLKNVITNGGEVLLHYSGNLLETSPDSLWYDKVVKPKRLFEDNGFTIRGLTLADSSEKNTSKGNKFCHRYYDYADWVGISPQYDLHQELMLSYKSISEFKKRLDYCATHPGLYAFGFHWPSRPDEAWITTDALRDIIKYLKAKPNAVLTTYANVVDEFGSTELAERVKELEAMP